MASLIKNNKYILLVLLTITVFCCVFSYIKSGYDEDEIVTYALSNSTITPSPVYDNGFNLPTSTDRVVYGDELHEFIVVDQNDRFNYQTTYENQAKDVHPPLYYYLLHTICSLTPGIYSKYQGLVLNLLFYLGCIIFLYRLNLLLTGDSAISSLSVLLFGLCNGALSCFLFIRMYILVLFFTAMLTFYIAKLFSDITGNTSRFYAMIILSVWLGGMTHYNYVIFAFFIILITDIVFLVKKQFRKFLLTSVSGVSGILLLIITFPAIFSQLSVGTFSGTVSVQSSFSNITNGAIWIKRLRSNTNLLLMMSDSFLYSFIILALLLLILILLSKNSQTGTIAQEPLYLVISFVLAFVTIVITAPVVTNRYIYWFISIFTVIISIMMVTVRRLLSQVVVNNHSLKRYSFIAVFSFIVLISVFCLTMALPDYLKLEYSDYQKITKEHSSAPCILVLNKQLPLINENVLPFLEQFDSTYIVNEDEILTEGLTDYIAGHENNDNLVIFIDTAISDPESVITSIENKTDYSDHVFLFQTICAGVYELS